MCGAALDLALGCVLAAKRSEQQHPPGQKSRLGGFAFLTCCHHMCEWASFINKPLLLRHGIGEGEFRLLCKVSE